MDEASKRGSGDDITLGIIAYADQLDSRPVTPAPEKAPSGRDTPDTKMATLDTALRRLDILEGKLNRLRFMFFLALLTIVAILSLPTLRHSISAMAGARTNKSAQNPSQGSVLMVSQERNFALKEGRFTAKDLGISTAEPDEVYARVQKRNDNSRSSSPLELVNESREEWTVTVPGKKEEHLKRGDAVPLAPGVVIKFNASSTGEVG